MNISICIYLANLIKKIELYFAYKYYNIYNIKQMTTFKPVSVYFKMVQTEYTKNYLVYPNWTITEFQAALRPLIRIDFEINDNFELIPTGQDDSEDGTAIQLINAIKLYEVWTPQLCVGFYIRG